MSEVSASTDSVIVKSTKLGTIDFGLYPLTFERLIIFLLSSESGNSNSLKESST